MHTNAMGVFRLIATGAGVDSDARRFGILRTAHVPLRLRFFTLRYGHWGAWLPEVAKKVKPLIHVA